MGWFNKGQNDASTGKGPASMQNAPHQAKEKYDAGYKNGKR